MPFVWACSVGVVSGDCSVYRAELAQCLSLGVGQPLRPGDVHPLVRPVRTSVALVRPVSRSHIRMVPSVLALTRAVPPGVNATEATGPQRAGRRGEPHRPAPPM
jgi:hypothetical protein